MRLIRVIGKIFGVVALCWAVFTLTVYAWMRMPPEQFAAKMAKLPPAAMMLAPFETMWSRARGGSLQPGDAAPDFDLESVDKTSRVRLSSERGRPVVLVFGSYT